MGKNPRRSAHERAIMRVEHKPSESADLSTADDAISIGFDRSISINLMKLHAPTNVYDADFSWIVHRPGAVSLFFAKRRIDEKDTLRTRLELRYPPENFVNHLWKNSRDFHDRLQKFAAKWPKDEERDQQTPETWKAEKDHSEWANFETMSHAGTEASLDFYLLPPWGLAQFTKGRGSAQLKVAAIVRVEMTIFELGRLLDSAAKVVSEIERYLPKQEPEEIQQEETP
jgi:hypothetical protein